MPPFDRVASSTSVPAFDRALRRPPRRDRRDRRRRRAPTFDNTIDALERSGTLLDRVSRVFFNLAGADTNDALQAIERDIGAAARRAQHAHLPERGAVPPRRRALIAAQELGLSAEQERVLERYHRAFVSAPAPGSTPRPRSGLPRSPQRLADLGTSSARTCSPTSRAYTLVLEREATSPACPTSCAPRPRAGRRASAACPASSHHAVALQRSSRSCSSPPGATCARRPSRPGRARRPTAARPTTAGIIAEILALRAERAQAARLRD